MCPPHRLLRPTSPDYPKRLARLPVPPDPLFAAGVIPGRPMVAVVGTRGALQSSNRLARRLGQALVRQGLAVVSGGAIGVDAAAHEGALDGGGPTVAVLGSGLQQLYPERNRQLLLRIAGNGALLSPFELAAPPRRPHFPQRNLLVAALARVVVVVEAPRRSGALNTARHARSLGIPLLAAPCGAGARALLQRGAGLLRDVDDVLRAVACGAVAGARTPPRPGDLRRALGVLQVRGTPVSADEVAHELGWTVSRAAASLLRLELGGWACVVPGGRYRSLA